MMGMLKLTRKRLNFVQLKEERMNKSMTEIRRGVLEILGGKQKEQGPHFFFFFNPASSLNKCRSPHYCDLFEPSCGCKRLMTY
ncbi:hypothetical protein EUGRSUZ_B02039 [Eucalyptus grandis]|uniref:Uncharacterized protein n=2 Tax=Eucalyptus grandis TaxID=71139 RepID=A0ACC3LS10_EUCGR|nr:hypothetical protein EUGRSUZ_B02039 [Eucalyptus grandis]